MEKQDNIQNIRDLYLNNKLQECINEASKFNDLPTNNGLMILYHGLSLFEQSKHRKGLILIESLTKQAGSGNIETDLIIFIMYQKCMFQFNKYKSEQNNSRLHHLCQEYQKTHSNFESSQIYLAGIGFYYFIDSYRSDNLNRCFVNLKKALQVQPTALYQDILFITANCYSTRSKFEEAIKFYEKLNTTNSNYPNLQLAIAMVYMKNINKNKALKNLKKAEQQNPENINVLNGFATFYKENGKKVKALEYFSKSYALNSTHPQTCSLYAQYLFDNQQQEKGSKILKDSILSYPEDSCEAIMLLSTAKQGKGWSLSYQEQLNLLFQCIDIQPQEGYYYFLIGERYYLCQQYDKAIIYLEDSLNFKLKKGIKASANELLGQSLYHLKRYEESVVPFLNVYALNSKVTMVSILFKLEYLLFNNSKISKKKQIQIIDSLEAGDIQPSLDNLFLIASEREDLQLTFLKKLQEYLTVLQILAFQQNIEPELHFKSTMTFWDLILDL